MRKKNSTERFMNNAEPDIVFLAQTMQNTLKRFANQSGFQLSAQSNLFIMILLLYEVG